MHARGNVRQIKDGLGRQSLNTCQRSQKIVRCNLTKCHSISLGTVSWAVCRLFSPTHVIRYWNPSIWLAESWFLWENHRQVASFIDLLLHAPLIYKSVLDIYPSISPPISNMIIKHALMLFHALSFFVAYLTQEKKWKRIRVVDISEPIRLLKRRIPLSRIC